MTVVTHVVMFFFNDTATTEIYTLSLHDALPISSRSAWSWTPGTRSASTATRTRTRSRCRASRRKRSSTSASRSEEHTSELQSHSDLVCRLLLEKKKQELER